jgi:tetratricopeptide (TPR) repeat protein
MTPTQGQDARLSAAPTPRRGLGRRLLFFTAAALLLTAAVLLAQHWLQGWLQRQDALQLVRQGKFAEAKPLLEQALGRAPRDPEVLEAMVTARLRSGDLLTDVIPYLSRWCDVQPGNAAPYRLRLGLWSQLGQEEQALADGEHLLTLTPEDDEVRREVAELLLAASRLDEAESECRRCLERRPEQRPALLYLRARILMARHDTAGAAAVLDPLLQEVPNFTPALLLRARLHCDAEEYDRAIPLLRQALTLDPAYQQTARYYLSQALARTGQEEEARSVLAELQRRQALDRLAKDSVQQPDNFDLQVQAGEALLAAGRIEEARRLLESVLARSPQHAGAHRALAACYDRLGQPARAEEHRRQAGPIP